ncbi:MFS transporter [Brevibacterium sp. RIT 803]|uniref:MFS transporter n=1 Tax=Brevibacterium sp. RIT 803 TaxID=2810210 RepID=UPI00194E570E|nr:MFS transporter [Brevibacterium sp. RIT 803]MBM6588466.1 MFS transporter [Brevibacterium sp. RIT 803]
MTAHVQTQHPDSRGQRKAIWAGGVGNFVEWFDYGVYGFLAVTISTVFFPSGDPTAALLSTFGIFALPVITRPLGSVIFARFGDTAGRKVTLAVVLLLMSLSTAAIGAIPPYASIGVWAPILLILARIVQGFSAGGEYAGGAVLIAENSPRERRGFLVGFMPATTGLGLLAGSMFAVVLSAMLDSEQMHSWGWRIPFLIALPIGAIGLYIRFKLEETSAFKELLEQDEVARSPLSETIGTYGKSVLQVTGIAMAQTVAYYVILVYAPTFLTTHAGHSSGEALLSTSIAIAGYVITIPIAGALSDKIGRKPLMVVGGVLLLVLVFPAFATMSVAPLWVIVLVQFLTGGVALGLYTGPLVCAWVELFPARVRYSGVAIGFSLAVIVSVSSPFILTWLISLTDSNLIPPIYVALSCVVSLLALLGLKESAPAKASHDYFTEGPSQ